MTFKWQLATGVYLARSQSPSWCVEVHTLSYRIVIAFIYGYIHIYPDLVGYYIYVQGIVFLYLALITDCIYMYMLFT